MKNTPTFDDFWRIYPLKKGKEDAAKQEANRRYWEDKRKAKARKPPISGKAIADKLSERFKVTRV